MSMDFNKRPLIITDLETTGLDPMTQDIIEIGAIRVDQNLKELDRYEAKIKIQNPATVSQQAMNVNGYTEAAWKDATDIRTAMLAFNQLAKEGVLVSWNITFEYTFLSESYRRTKVTNLMDYHRIDLPTIAWFVFPNENKINMSNIAEKLGMGKEPNPHRAMTGTEYALGILREFRSGLYSGVRRS
jgi:DNA polymerase-3 subunit alpha (Gram-positive type)